ncbi:hypothetical protein WJX82_011603 [Trebouxia sp. C0006]
MSKPGPAAGHWQLYSGTSSRARALELATQVKPLATINVGPRMNLPQQEVMYDLVGFVVRTGGSELSKARFKTLASAPSGRWFLFDEGEDVREVEWTHVLREFPYISAYSVRVKDEPRPPPPPLLRYRGVLCGGSWSGWGWVDLWLREVLAYKRFLSFLSAPVSLDVTVLMVFLLYLREQLQEFRFYKGLMWLMSCLGLGRIINWFWRDRNI